MRTVHIFVDAILPNNEEHKNAISYRMVEFLESNIEKINNAGIIAEVVPIQNDNDKKVLLDEKIHQLPSLLLEDKRVISGFEQIQRYLAGNSIKKRVESDPQDVLRREQLAEMDIDKYNAGEYDDDGEEDEDGMGGDKEARKQNLQYRMAEFNKRRKGRIEEKPVKPGKTKRKPAPRRRQQQDPDDDDDDHNVEPPQAARRGGARKTADVNPEEYDEETRQLLDKGGSD